MNREEEKNLPKTTFLVVYFLTIGRKKKIWTKSEKFIV